MSDTPDYEPTSVTGATFEPAPGAQSEPFVFMTLDDWFADFDRAVFPWRPLADLP